MLAGKNIVDTVNLLLYDKGFTSDTVADDDILVYDSGTGLWTLETVVRDVTELLLYGEVFTTPDTPADNDVLIYDLNAGYWRMQTNLLNPISGIAFLTEGYDLEIGDGDIILASGGLVDGVKISEDALTREGGGFGASPPENAILYWRTADTPEWNVGHETLLNGTNTTLHYHDADRARADHTGTQAASTISDFEDVVGDMFDSSGNEHDMVAVEYTSDEKVNLSLDVPFVFAYVASDIATNGTTYVDLILTHAEKNLFTHTNGNANVEFKVTGTYMITLTVNSNFNINNSLMHTRLVRDTGGGYAEMFLSYRASHTSSALGSLVAYAFGPYTLTAGDEVKLQSKFGAADAGSNFLADKCTLSIWRVW